MLSGGPKATHFLHRHYCHCDGVGLWGEGRRGGRGAGEALTEEGVTLAMDLAWSLPAPWILSHKEGDAKGRERRLAGGRWPSSEGVSVRGGGTRDPFIAV